MQQFLTKIDQFGSEQKLQIHPFNPIQQSIFGGVMTIILYGASLAFFLSELVDWAQNNKLPKITSYRKSVDQAESVIQKGRVLEIFYYEWEDGDLDPFDPQNLTFYPIVTQIVGQMQNQTILPTLFEQTKLENGKIKNTFYLEDLEIVGSPPNNQYSTNFTDYRIAIMMCNQSSAPNGFQCANDERNQKYFQQVTYFSIVYYSDSFDSKQKKLLKTPKYDSLRINQDSAELYQITQKLSNTQTDDGILFSNLNMFSYISDFTASSYKVDLSQAIQTYGAVTPLIVYLTLDQLKEQFVIEYPKISEILAETGSIISWILQISFFVFKYNDKICTDKTINDIISLYYPDFHELNMKYNFFGKCISVNMKDKKYDPSKVTQIVQKISSIALKKVNFINLQHEVSRLQFAITSTNGIGFFKNLINEETIESLMDNLGCRIDEGATDNNSIKIIPEQYLENKFIQKENFEVSKGNFENISFEMLEQSIDLLNLKKQDCYQKEKPFNEQQKKEQVQSSFQIRADDIS